MEMYRDAAKGLCDHAVLCSNDSDAEPALKAIKEDFMAVRLGVIAPRQPGKGSPRVVSTSLAQWSDWTRRHLLDEELIAAQLPPVIGRIGRKSMTIWQ